MRSTETGGQSGHVGLGRETNLGPLLEREVLLAVETAAPLLCLNVLFSTFSL